MWLHQQLGSRNTYSNSMQFFAHNFTELCNQRKIDGKKNVNQEMMKSEILGEL